MLLSRSNLLAAFIFFASYIDSSQSQKPPRPSITANSLELTANQLYMYWAYTNTTIRFEIQMRSEFAWLAFGIKDALGSDLVVAWLGKDANGHFSNQEIAANGSFSPKLDSNWRPLFAALGNDADYTRFIFERNIKLGCSADATASFVDVTTGKMSVVFAVGSASLIDHAAQKLVSSVTSSSLSTVSVQLLDESSKGTLGGCPSDSQPRAFNSTPTQAYPFAADLLDQGDLTLFWDYTATTFVGEIHARTLGWVGFGFSPDGKMSRSDVVIGWIGSDLVANFTDRFIGNGGAVKIDRSQDWTLSYSAEKGGYTIFKFQRPIKLCNPEDRSIEVSK